MIERHVKKLAFADSFGRQMRFITGPRQCGKTTLAKSFLAAKKMDDLYYNWDLHRIRERYRRDYYFFETAIRDLQAEGKGPWICLDEIHKVPKWKNILKDYFDEFEEICHFIVTGSARLDWFRRSGDSLAGRYFLFKLGPLNLSECCHSIPSVPKREESAESYIEKRVQQPRYEQKAMEQLLNFSGFPEPFLKDSSAFHQRWQHDIFDRILREDIRDLTRILEIENVIHMIRLLPDRMGSPLSLNALKEDLSMSYPAVRNAVSALQFTYMIFFVPPYQKKIARALKKEKKCYFYDWSIIKDPGVRFENYVAWELKSRIDYWNDSGEIEAELFYIRTKEGKETDFLITIDEKPWCLFEVKTSPTAIASHHHLHSKMLGDVPFIQITKEDRVMKKIAANFYSISASRFFK